MSDKITVCGVDPGMNRQSPGGYAVIGGWQPPAVWSLDVLVDPNPKLKRKLLDAQAMFRQLCADRPVYVAIEDVHTMTGQGLASSGNLMKSVGIVYAVAICAGAKVLWIQPAQWKAYFNIPGKKKSKLAVDMALDLARRLYPALSHPLKRKKDIGRAEALLIARYAVEVAIPKHEAGSLIVLPAKKVRRSGGKSARR